jgi:broad specificity phosphatase PhoE
VRTVPWLVTLFLLIAPAVAHAQSIVFVVRHAERADGGPVAGQMSGVQDPPLSKAGAARAAKLAAMLADAGITAIYATEYRRTQETAQPLAATRQLQVQTLPARDTATAIAKIKAAHPKDVVLIVGHSNTVPEIVKAFGGSAVTVADDEYDNLFIVVPATGAMTRVRF